MCVCARVCVRACVCACVCVCARTCLQESVNMMNEGEQYDIAVDAIMSGTERLFASMGNTQEMVKQAKILAEATSSLVNAIKLEAENENDPGEWVYQSCMPQLVTLVLTIKFLILCGPFVFVFDSKYDKSSFCCCCFQMHGVDCLMPLRAWQRPRPRWWKQPKQLLATHRMKLPRRL